MLHRTARCLTSRAVVTGRRALSTTWVPTQAAEDFAFMEAWKKVAPDIEAPKMPMTLMQPCAHPR